MANGGAEADVIEWSEAARGPEGLVIYRIEAEMDHPIAPGGGRFDPMRGVLSRHATATTRRLDEDFAESGAPVGASSMRVACHVISYPDHWMVVDATFPATGSTVFSETLGEISREEGRSLSDRPLDVLYTHCHFDHAGGRDAVEELGSGVRTMTHPLTEALFAQTSQRENFFVSKGHFFRDCEIGESIETLMLSLHDLYLEAMGGVMPEEPPRNPLGSASDAPLRVDVRIDPGDGGHPLLDGRAEALCFEGHIPGHLCVRVAGDHLITGDMWLPATTSTVTPPGAAELAGVSGERCGVKLYMDSSARLLELDVDDCASYPSHEDIFRNPKRMAMRDLELLHERFQLVYSVLAEHTQGPMRVLDLTWGGQQRAPIWKLESSLYRVVMAHDEAAAYVHDLVEAGDLEEVESERYVYTGSRVLLGHLEALLDRGRQHYGHLEFRSYRRSS